MLNGDDNENGFKTNRTKYIDLARAKSEAPGLLTRIYNLNQKIVNLYSTNQLTLEHIYVTFDGKAK